MATIIDSLLVTLGLDSSGFNKGKTKVDQGLKDTGDHADKTGAKFKKSGKDGAEGFDTVAKSAAKFLALLGGTMAIQRFISETVQSSAALDRLAKNLDESVSTISAWSNATEIAGGSAEGLQGSLDMLSKSQTELQLTGQSSLIPFFSALGVAIADANGKARPANDMLLELSDRFSRMDRTSANNMGRMMGFDQGTMNLLLKGRGEVELMLKRQKEFGAVSKQQAEEATRLARAFAESKQSFNAFGRELLSNATPALEKLFAILSEVGAWIRKNKVFVETFLTVLAVGLAAVGLAVTPINLAALAILALAAAFAALWDDYQVWKSGGDSFLPWAKWQPGIEAAKTGLKFLKDLLIDILIRSVAVADALVSLAKGDFAGAKIAAKAAIFGIPGEGLQGPGAPVAPKGDARQRFINEASARLKVPASVIDAQLRLETGATGASTIGSFNYGNLKSGKNWAGASKSKNVTEYDGSGKARTEAAAFRSYSSPEDAAADYSRLLASRYPGAVGATNAADFAGALQRGGYATDPKYVSKVVGVANASRFAAGAGASRMASANVGGNRSVETNIGEIKVYTAATDAHGIANDMGNSMDYLFTSQANRGLD